MQIIVIDGGLADKLTIWILAITAPTDQLHRRPLAAGVLHARIHRIHRGIQRLLDRRIVVRVDSFRAELHEPRVIQFDCGMEKTLAGAYQVTDRLLDVGIACLGECFRNADVARSHPPHQPIPFQIGIAAVVIQQLVLVEPRLVVFSVRPDDLAADAKIHIHAGCQRVKRLGRIRGAQYGVGLLVVLQAEQVAVIAI
ncbi:MAG: hypothetical protein B7Y27_14280 [Hydrogenophilales bacterium 16-64-40]|nr:MAG: hypothetical protein B7Y27_14280 [Hydrogenophilales bacterium 16-64-40]